MYVILFDGEIGCYFSWLYAFYLALIKCQQGVCHTVFEVEGGNKKNNQNILLKKKGQLLFQYPMQNCQLWTLSHTTST